MYIKISMSWKKAFMKTTFCATLMFAHKSNFVGGLIISLYSNLRALFFCFFIFNDVVMYQMGQFPDSFTMLVGIDFYLSIYLSIYLSLFFLLLE